MPGTCTLLKGGMWSPFRGLVKKNASESLNYTHKPVPSFTNPIRILNYFYV